MSTDIGSLAAQPLIGRQQHSVQRHHLAKIPMLLPSSSPLAVSLLQCVFSGPCSLDAHTIKCNAPGKKLQAAGRRRHCRTMAETALARAASVVLLPSRGTKTPALLDNLNAACTAVHATCANSTTMMCTIPRTFCDPFSLQCNRCKRHGLPHTKSALRLWTTLPLGAHCRPKKSGRNHTA